MKQVKDSKLSKNLKMTAVFCLIFAVSLSGCADNEQNNADNNSGQNNKNISPSGNITPKDNVTGNATTETELVVTEADSGKSISLKNGKAFSLKLRENPSTGASWQLNLSQGLSILSDEYTQDPAPEDYTGVPGTHQWEIKAVTTGSQQVKGIYKRPWEDTTGTEENFTLNVEVV